ncbi:hypothetical protein [Marinospirillum perlucidum]|uniref:hypothetical protein n=1 Tax=Marinospirillum perlucidum TaxID=1982602 RepID=UPI000DF18DCD|nr:hypothetical protein [Marinospirillum perlucidum]
MKNDLSVRSMLVDKMTGKYIKAVDERDLCDYLPLLTKDSEEGRKVQIFDFTPIVQYFHSELESKLKQREHRDLIIKRGTVFNTWMRLRTITNDNLLCQLSSQIMKDSEEVLSWIHTRLPDLKLNISAAVQQPNSYTNAKTEALKRFSDDVEVFFEVLLCNIHTTAKVDITSLKSDFIITEHCQSIRADILELLENETDYRNREFSWSSSIHNICMEDLGINAEALVHLIDSEMSVEDIKRQIINQAKWETEWQGSREYRKYTLSIPKADDDKIERIKILSRLLENINSILSLLDRLKNSDAYFNEDSEEQAEFESNIKGLLPNQNITSHSK